MRAYKVLLPVTATVLLALPMVGLAQDRQDGIRRQVQLGARAAILLTENEQNLLRRQSLLVAAERDLANAAQRLSLFWRDAPPEQRCGMTKSTDDKRAYWSYSPEPCDSAALLSLSPC